MKWHLWLMGLGTVGSLVMATPERSGTVLYADDFSNGLGQWVVEQQPGGTVTTKDGQMIIADEGGCSVWFCPRLTAPLVIRYQARVSSAARVSDLNCFWMATDPAHPDDLFSGPSHRSGKFADYDALRTYYVGYGGNANTTTRFRRYDGTGARPLEPGHDLRAPEFLLKPDHVYHIELVATGDGRVQFIRDGQTIFDYRDSAPLRSGWFGFRTVQSRIELSHFEVIRPGATAP